MDHLKKSSQDLLQLTQEERIKSIRDDIWIGYSRSQQIHKKLEDLLDHPPIHRMPNLLIVGETNNGKTLLVNKFAKKYEAFVDEEKQEIHSPVVLIQAPPVPNERRLYDIILNRLHAPFKLNDRAHKKLFQVMRLFRHMNVRMLIMDEIHHILAGSSSKQKEFLNVIKYLANELQISIVGVGTKDAFRVIATEPQLSNRFEPAVLPKWELNKEYLRLLASFEYVLPLKKRSQLTQKNLAIKVLSMSEGTIGEISKVLRKSAVQAIQTGKEHIDIKILNSISYQSPSDRKKQRNLV